MSKTIGQTRIHAMLKAVMGRSDYSPATQLDWWLQDAWTTILWRIDTHVEAGRTNQAEAWRQCARFFARRYDGQFPG